jgi:hypothetical protein
LQTGEIAGYQKQACGNAEKHISGFTDIHFGFLFSKPDNRFD